MASNYFKDEHFQLLDQWKGTAYEKTDPEQRQVYTELSQAYDVTKRWADALQKQLFKDGWTKVVRKPTDQWQRKFLHYNWARIYPAGDSPEGLAYTVGIEAQGGFVVKIDLVDSKIDDPTLRKTYEQIRGSFASSPIVAIKSIEEGLALDFTELVDWSVSAIKNFGFTYDDLAARLNLSAQREEKTLLSHFRGHRDFVERQPLWPKPTTALFVRVARAVNEIGLDWWFTKTTNSQLRFGRKEKNTSKGRPMGALFLRKDGISINWAPFGGLEDLASTNLTSDLVQLLEAVDTDKGTWPPALDSHSDREGHWPDDYAVEDESKSVSPPKNVIYYGPPGTGKTLQLQELLASEYADEGARPRHAFVTFHQSYGYEEFVEGLRPVVIQRGEKSAPGVDSATPSQGEVQYEVKPGVFRQLCELARENPSRQYAMVIDEINRGNISKIFGELITLLEVDKREGARYQVEVTLPYSGDVFSVPSNVDVIGAMNTADRSLALVDTALRRRFEFVELMPMPSLLTGTIVSHKGVEINIEQMLTMLNARIEALYDRDHTVGHAYFIPITHLPGEHRFDALKAVFKNKIIPLLEEYFFEDWQKIRLVLGDNQKSHKDSHLQFVHEIGREKDLLALFGQQHELDQYSVRLRYRLNPDALNHPDAYVGIYAGKAAATDTDG